MDDMQWRAWPVSWSGVWVGALAALAVGLIIGLIGYAVGAHEVASPRPTDAHKLRMIAVAFNIAGLMGGVLGGWLASSEPMSIGYYRRRWTEDRDRVRRVA